MSEFYINYKTFLRASKRKHNNNNRNNSGIPFEHLNNYCFAVNIYLYFLYFIYLFLDSCKLWVGCVVY